MSPTSSSLTIDAGDTRIGTNVTLPGGAFFEVRGGQWSIRRAEAAQIQVEAKAGGQAPMKAIAKAKAERP